MSVRAALMRGCGALVLLLIPAASLIGTAGAARADAVAEQTLADRYAPVIVVRTHDLECGDGEPYLPVPVDVVLGRSDVVLRGPDGQVITAAPTAADLFGLGDGYYLDYPGDPLNPGCGFETWFHEVSQGVEPTVYAHIASDPAHPGQLALQYWFFWTFNDWNDKHEGDWEMIQLLFDATTAEEALRTEPVSTAYAQHEGSETAEWSTDKVLREGMHPAVYPAQGSHAAYYTQAEWFGKSAASGFGCDNTMAPGTVITPKVVVVPTTVTSKEDAFAWVSFTGRWGQKAPSFNNGPTGPNTKTQWEQPVAWQLDEGRTDAVALPPLPGPAVGAFCGLTTAGSLLFIGVLANPWLVIGAVVTALVLAVVGIRRTRWRPASTDPLDTSRRAGQIVSASVRLYATRPGLFLPLSLVLLVSDTVVTVLQSLILAPRASGDLADVDGTADALPQALSGLIGLVIGVPVSVLVVAAVAYAFRDITTGSSPGGWQALRDSVTRPRAAVTALVQGAVPALLSASVLLIPVGLWLLSRWAAAFPASAFEDRRAMPSLRRSSTLTRGHRWRTLWLTLLLLALGSWTGPLVGTLLLLLTDLPFWAANLVTGVVGALALPILATALTLQFLDLRRRAEGGQDDVVDSPTEGALR